MNILNILTQKRRTGNLGEDLAVKHLKSEGYKILARNYVANNYEIDIIAEDKTTLSFIEVKTRTNNSSKYEPRPSSSVTPEKQRKIIWAAKYFIGINGNKGKYINLDVIEVYLNSDGTSDRILHIKNAFNYNTAYKKGK